MSSSFDTARLAVLRASGWISMGPAGWRVLLAMTMNADFAEFTKNGILVYCQTTMHLHQQTAVSDRCIRSTRRKLREVGLITLMNPEATHSDKVSVYRLNPYPVEPLNREAHPSTGMLEVVAARIIRRRKRDAVGTKRRRHAAARQQAEQAAAAAAPEPQHQQEEKQPRRAPQLLVSFWPDDLPLPVGVRRASGE